MSIVYLPVDGIPDEMTSAEQALAIDEQCWNLYRPASIQDPNDATRQLFPMVTRESDGMVAIVGETTEPVYISPEVDLTELIALLPNVPQAELDMLVLYVDMNKGGYVPFESLIPSTSEQLTEAEAVAAGWPPVTQETP